MYICIYPPISQALVKLVMNVEHVFRQASRLVSSNKLVNKHKFFRLVLTISYKRNFYA